MAQSNKLHAGSMFRHWKIIKKLGEGSFGIVYQLEHMTTKEHCAMKTEPATEQESTLIMEIAVLKTFRNSQLPHPHVCDYVDSGVTSTLRYVMMKLAGTNLFDVRKSCPKRRFTESTTVRLGIQCVRSIESLHLIGFIHRDIKPSNYAIGRDDDQRTVYMLDFGLARQYVNKEGSLRPPRNYVGFRGTVRYAPLNTHLRRELGRHDDLWCLLYMLIELQQGRLPWGKLSAKDEIGKMKKRTLADELLKGMAPEFHDILNELQGLQYMDTPDYGRFCDRLKSVMDRQKYRDEDPYDWEKGGLAHESFRKAAIPADPFKRQQKEQKKVKKEIRVEEKSHLSL